LDGLIRLLIAGFCGLPFAQGPLNLESGKANG
jgi:hypothetical protein